MKIIFGLGNPSKKFAATRHNAGFLAVDNYLEDKQPISCQSKFQAEICELHMDGPSQTAPTKVLFIKPQTFMNDSGSAVAEITNFYKVDLANDILIIHDDVDLPLGTLRETDNSSAAGHNGIKSLIEHLGTQEFHRLRIGVEARAGRHDLPTDAFVLQEFQPDELATLREKIFPEIRKKIDGFIHKPAQTKNP